jgi:hypothetical protein
MDTRASDTARRPSSRARSPGTRGDRVARNELGLLIALSRWTPTKDTGVEPPPLRLNITIFGLGTRGEEKFNVPADFNFLKVTAVGKDVRRLPYGPDRDMQRISELFGSNSGATGHWIDFSKDLGSYKARAQTEMFIASQPFDRTHLPPPSTFLR